MSKFTAEISVEKYNFESGESTRFDDVVAAEHSLTLSAFGQVQMGFTCTPEDLEPLVAGWLYTALTDFEMLGRPVLAKLSGDAGFVHTRVTGIMADAFPKASKVRRFIRAAYKDGRVSLSPYNHSSGALFALLGCNALIDVPAGSPGLEVGDRVELVML